MAKKITLKDLATQLGVSAATVSRALNDSHEISEPIKRKVKQVATAMGYRPDRIASQLRTGKTQTIGVVIPALAYNFNVKLIEGLEETVIPKGYKVLIFQTREQYQREKEAIDYLLSIGVDGIIASVSAETQDDHHLKHIIEQEKPLVLVDRTISSINASKVVIDHEKASYQAVEHLIQTGCKTIAWIQGPKEHPLSNSRCRGYRQALADYGLSFNQRLVAYCDFQTDMGFSDTLRLLTEYPEIDGIYAINDRFAIAAMGALHHLHKRIPEDVAVVGFNNEPYNALLNPSLSSVDQPALEMGRSAGRLLLEHLRESSFRARQITLETELVVRGSTQKPG